MRVSKRRLGMQWGNVIVDWPLDAGYGRPRPAVIHGQIISQHLSDLSCFLYRQTEAGAFALPGRWSGVTRVISARRQMPLPLRCHCPLFCCVRASGMPATATVKQTSEQLIASAVIAGDNYPAHNRPIVGRSLVSILGRILRMEKKD